MLKHLRIYDPKLQDSLDTAYMFTGAEALDMNTKISLYYSWRDRLWGWLLREVKVLWRKFLGKPIYFSITIAVPEE